MSVVTLGQNIASLKGQRSLASASERLSTVAERLSSGQRINRAADDAAGLAISSTLESKTRVYTQGIRNLNDGLSFLNIADGALDALSSVSIRVSELAEQSANETYSAVQRLALQREADAQRAEFNRIAQSAEFNGQKVLTPNQTVQLQDGYGTDGILQLSLSRVPSVGIGDGTFQEGVGVSVALGNPLAVVSGDFNNDGHADLVGIGLAGVNVMVNTGDGTFTQTQSLNPFLPRNGGVADMNGDGNADLIYSGGSVSDYVNVRLGIGNGTFGAALSYAGNSISGGSSNQSEILLGDLNNDGSMDVVSIQNNGFVAAYINNGDGSLQAPLLSTTPPIGQSGELGDVNGDGILDLVVLDHDNNTFEIKHGLGDGTFSSIQTFVGDSAVGLHLADMDGDGSLDLLGEEGPNIYIYRNRGDGTFDPAQTYVTGVSAGIAPEIWKAIDINKDGRLDVVALGGPSNSRMLAALQNSDGTFTASYENTLGDTGQNNDFTAVDLNGDGIIDLARGGTSNIYVFFGNGVQLPGIDPIDISSAAAARSTLDTMQSLIEQLGLARSDIGAFQSRIQAAIRQRTALVGTLESARSTILDADMAADAADLARLQILQDTAVAVVGQANTLPRLAVQLLG